MHRGICHVTVACFRITFFKRQRDQSPVETGCAAPQGVSSMLLTWILKDSSIFGTVLLYEFGKAFCHLLILIDHTQHLCAFLNMKIFSSVSFYGTHRFCVYVMVVHSPPLFVLFPSLLETACTLLAQAYVKILLGQSSAWILQSKAVEIRLCCVRRHLCSGMRPCCNPV